MPAPRVISLRAPEELHEWTVSAELADARVPSLSSMRLIEPGSPEASTEFIPPNHPICATLEPVSASLISAGQRGHHSTWRLVDRTPITAAYEPDDADPGTRSLRYELRPNTLDIELVEHPGSTGPVGLIFAFPRTLLAADDQLAIHVGGLSPALDATGSIDPVPAEDVELVWTTSDRAIRMQAHPANAPGVSWTVHRPAVPGHPGVPASHIELLLRWTETTNVTETIRRGCIITPRRGI